MRSRCPHSSRTRAAALVALALLCAAPATAQTDRSRPEAHPPAPAGVVPDPSSLAADPTAPPAEPIDLEPSPQLYAPEPDDDARPHLWLGGRGGLWWLSIDGTTVRAAGGSVGGSTIDLNADLSFDDTFTVPYVEAHLRTRWISLYADFFQFDESARTTLDADVVFGGATFSASTPVRGRLEALSVGGRIEFLPLAFDTWEFALLLGGRYYRLTAELKSLSPSLDVGRSETVEGGLPFAGAAARIYPTRWSELYAQGQGLYYARQGDRVTYAELEAGAALRLLGDRVALIGAYRALLAEIEVEGDRWETTWHGPVVMLRLQI